MELLKELFRFRRYKASQGRLIRRLTMVGVWLLFLTGAWKCTHLDFMWIAAWAGKSGESAGTFALIFSYSIAGLIALFGIWFGYRLVQWTTFADFLISVEGEMAKVSWPGKAELRSSTIVVLTVFLLLSAMIYVADLILVFLFKFTGVV
jgi:preprotein translocase subunit SecE